MSYGYFRTESPEGTDYSFYSTKTSRIYTVSFEMSLYVEYTDSLPILVKHGYGLLFKYQKTRNFEKGSTNIDSEARETIADIIKDFLNSQHLNCFVVYECHDFKHEKFFSKWYEEYSEGEDLVKEGITLSIDEDETHDIHFGFITTSKNKLLDLAKQEVQKFGVSFMM